VTIQLRDHGIRRTQPAWRLQAGVFSLHFIFRDEDHLSRALADKGVSDAFRAMIQGVDAGRPGPRPHDDGLP